MGETTKIGYLHQLRMMLWKNFTLKKRTPFVLVVELCMPLLLFVVLLAIRQMPSHMPKPVGTSHHSAQALPSAGITAILQEFCDGGYTDENGFLHYQHSSLASFLESLQGVAEQNNFFEPPFSLGDMDHIPALYHSIIDDPAELHNALVKARDVSVSDMFVNVSELSRDLEQTYNLSVADVNTLLNANVNFTEVYDLLYGLSNATSVGSRSKRSIPDEHSNLPPLLTDMDPSELLHKASTLANATWRHLHKGDTGVDVSNHLSQAKSMLNDLTNSGVKKSSPFSFLKYAPKDSFYNGLIYQSIRRNPSLLRDPEVIKVLAKLMGFDTEIISPVTIVDVLKKLLLTGDNLQYLTCTDHELERILVVPKEQENNLEDMALHLCNMTTSQWESFASLILQHTSSEDIVKKLHLDELDYAKTKAKVKEFYKNIHEFIEFEKSLTLLNNLTSRLPNATCTSATHLTPTETPTNATNSTLREGDDNQEQQQQHHRSRRSVTDSPYAGLLRLWMGMSVTVCGKQSISQDNLEKYLATGNLDDLGLSDRQKNQLGLLVHVLFNNPKVLYAPNNTQVDDVIRKVNATFALVDTVSEYARKWLNVSGQLREYLTRNTTEQNLDAIREMQMELRDLPGVQHLISDPTARNFLFNETTPNTTFFLSQLDAVDNAACTWLRLLSGISLNVFRGFATEDELVNYFLHEAYGDGVTVLASLVFDNLHENGTLPPHVKYRIRQNATLTQTTLRVRDKYWYPGPRSWGYKYYQFGFVWMQDVVERAIIDLHAGRDVREPGSYIHEMPYPCYKQDQFLFIIEHVMPLCLTISFVYSVAMLVHSIVYEKEQRLKEVMKMMGLNTSVHWLAWFLTSFAQMSITMATLTIILKFGDVLMYSNGLVIFVVLEIFAMATIAFTFLVSVCYSKAKVAAACAGIVYFLSYVPYMYVAIREEAAGDQIPAWTKSLASLFSTTAFGLGAKYFAFYEIEGVGVQWSNLMVSPVEDDAYNLLMVIIMMLADTALYVILTWYIENVHPGSYGLPKPWYFPFTSSYWCHHHVDNPPAVTPQRGSCWQWLLPWKCWGPGGRRRCYGDLSVMEEDQACALEGATGVACGGVSSSNFEPEPGHLRRGVTISGLRKVYKNGKLAVNNLSLNLYEGQITSFLGHNGAGKTTTMSILTGMFPPTSGFATIYDLDIRSEMEEIRKSLGMCPQHNVLFDKLTVEEHLWFYARLKGMSAADITQEMDTMIEDIGLPKKRHNTVDCLSGGMKRKLSVAIAFVAGSRTVILDEPTAGVDPYARRDIWDLLIKYKQDRTILLSTHHMDEADVLGDRIAIISGGRLKCAGSPLFLKATFGEGYHLILVKRPSELDGRSADTTDDDFQPQSFHTRCCEEKITAFINQHIETAYLKSESSQELHYILPFEAARKGGFEKLFKALDVSLAQLEVSSYGVVDTSLEEVFLKVTEQSIQGAEEENAQNENKELGYDLSPYPITTTSMATAPISMTTSVTSDMSIPEDRLVDFAPLPEVDTPLSFTPGTVNVELGNLIDFHEHAGSSHGGEDTVCDRGGGGSEVDSPARKGHHCRTPSMDSQNLRIQAAALNRPSHRRSPSDGAGHTAAPPPRHGHRRTPSDVSLRTLAAIRGTYTHHRTHSADVTRTTHHRSPSDGSTTPAPSTFATPVTPGTGMTPGHRRTESSASSSSSLLDVAGGDGSACAGGRSGEDCSLLSATDEHSAAPTGFVMSEGSALAAQQFYAILVKRFYYVRRNWKGVFSQILLPALFVCIAMTVALTAPNLEDLPPITLSPAQYYNYTQPQGNYIPYHLTPWTPESSPDAWPQALIQTFRMPSGIGDTCLLRSAYNSSFDMDLLKQINSTNRDYRLLADYFIPSCQSVFMRGLRLRNFVPPPPTAEPPATDGSGNENVTDDGSDEVHVPVTSKPLTPTTPRYYPHCHCAEDQTGQVCEKYGYVDPPSFRTVTNDVLQDISGNDESDFYLYTTDIYRLHRYGGFSFGLHREYVPEDFGKNAPSEFRKLGVRHVAKVWFNHKGYHAMPVYINTLNNAILRANIPVTEGNPAAYGITAINHPMNDTNTQLSLEAIEQGSDVLIAIFIICAMSFVPASFVVFLVYEKSIKAKHLQFVSGISRVIYWLANYAWDMANYTIPAVCCILILRVFNIPAYVSHTNFPAVISLFFMYGWSITPMMYPASFWFEEPSTAYIALIVINLFIGITCILTSFLLEMFGQDDQLLQQIHEVVKSVFLVFPNYCLGRGLMDIAFNEYRNQYFFKIGQYSEMKSPFEWMLMARNLVAMAAMGAIFFVITLLCEFNFFVKQKRVPSEQMLPVLDEDEDVAAERRRVLRGAGRHDTLRLLNLTKVYEPRRWLPWKRRGGGAPRHLAVDRLALGVPQGECFGLLGVNGAGKTTTFKMLTGDHGPSAGDATLNGDSVVRNLHRVQQNIGYCPQFDALYDELTPREHVQLYARLRGVPCREQAKVVSWALEKLSLQPYADRLAGTLSGGNRRKLSTAIALIGQPPVIFLDEPTTGMDPHSRRFLWDLILDLIKEGRSVILTSHSMEECEALCTRLAIMVNGTFRCLGSVQHLKTRFGDGYTVVIRVKGQQPERELAAVARFVQRHFPDAVHKVSHHNLAQYELPSASLDLARVFSTMEEAQRDLDIEDYSVSQNTLDNVFINFVEQQREIVAESLESLTTANASSNDLDPSSVTLEPNDLDLEADDIPVVTTAGTRLAFLNLDSADR